MIYTGTNSKADCKTQVDDYTFTIHFGVGFSAISYLVAIPFGGVGLNVINFCINFCNPFWSTFFMKQIAWV
jgi:hypothetical protein